MKASSLLMVFFLANLSCTTYSAAVQDRGMSEGYLRGQLAIGDSVVDEFELGRCFCNMTESGIQITNTNSGFEGQRLFTTLNRHDTLVSFNAWSCVGPSPVYVIQEYSVSLFANRFDIEDSLRGRIDAHGEFQEANVKKSFRIHGQFRCILKDSTYDFAAYETDWIRILNAKELERLRMVSLSNPDSVKAIDLGGFELTEIPVEIARFKRLRKLALAQNQIRKLDVAVLEGLDSLKELDLSGNPISELPDDIKLLKNLESLNLSGCKLNSIPDGLFELGKLTVLDLSATTLTKISKDIKHLKGLQVLDIGYSNIWIVPNEIFELPHLHSLALPDSIQMFKFQESYLPRLRKLDVPYELIEFNKGNITGFRRLHDLSISFRYEDDKEEENKHRNRIAFLEQALPSVRIFETVQIRH